VAAIAFVLRRRAGGDDLARADRLAGVVAEFVVVAADEDVAAAVSGGLCWLPLGGPILAPGIVFTVPNNIVPVAGPAANVKQLRFRVKESGAAMRNSRPA
jgi:hypothetical protein